MQSGEISTQLSIQLPTVKRILSALIKKGIIEKQGRGRSVSYLIR
ncbi:MAG: winged helix-turn-helix transcriptional regulator [Saprospiraceae bacterium]|nr:winged helix-turn-helix transcriptional regulator [Saprospiraceae bacterium]